jgi:hypothetical protein
MSVLEEVRELTHSNNIDIAHAAIRAIELNKQLANGVLSADEYNDLLDDVIKLNDIEKDMMTIDIYRLIVKAYNTILALKTLTSL